jgi:hypothetical protein
MFHQKLQGLLGEFCEEMPLCLGAGFANEGQFLAILMSSLGDVNRRLLEKQAPDATISTTPFQVRCEGTPEYTLESFGVVSARDLKITSFGSEGSKDTEIWLQCVVHETARTAVTGGGRTLPAKPAVWRQHGTICRGCMAGTSHRRLSIQCHW